MSDEIQSILDLLRFTDCWNSPTYNWILAILNLISTNRTAPSHPTASSPCMVGRHSPSVWGLICEEVRRPAVARFPCSTMTCFSWRIPYPNGVVGGPRQDVTIVRPRDSTEAECPQRMCSSSPGDTLQVIVSEDPDTIWQLSGGDNDWAHTPRMSSEHVPLRLSRLKWRALRWIQKGTKKKHTRCMIWIQVARIVNGKKICRSWSARR